MKCQQNRIELVTRPAEARAEADCDLGHPQLRQVLPVLLRRKDLHHPRSDFPGGVPLLQGARDGLLGRLSHHSHAGLTNNTMVFILITFNDHRSLLHSCFRQEIEI